MSRWTRGLFATILALTVGVLPVTGALSAGSAVPGSRVTLYQADVTADTLKPLACAGITVDTLSIGKNGSGKDELQLGSASGESMNARGGDDCVLGGGGNDSINCGGGTDVAIGGPGTDTFSSNCETQIQ